MDLYKQVLVLLSNKDVPGLHCLLETAFWHHSGPNAILKLLQCATTGDYAARAGFSDRDIDIGFLAKALGGPKLLYALQKSIGLPSASTVKKSQKIPALLPSVGIPTSQEISENIDSFFDPSVKPILSPSSLPIPGNTLMLDGVALETRIQYDAQRDCVIGLSCETASLTNTSAADLSSIQALCDALFGSDQLPKTVNIGKEATVVAIGPYAQNVGYTAVPIVLSPSDKTESGKELASWIAAVIHSWNSSKFGSAQQGPIWSIGTDGDSTFWMAKYYICMAQEIGIFDAALGSKLKRLSGLNLLASTTGIVSTCDPKHIIKCMLFLHLTY